jgi:hypothetical protein
MRQLLASLRRVRKEFRDGDGARFEKNLLDTGITPPTRPIPKKVRFQLEG